MLYIINYGLGNVRSFYNIFKELNIPCKISSNKEELKKATKLILPGVGSFDWAMERIKHYSLIDTLNNLVIEEKVPILGVCVGMQIMAKSSEEGFSKGLGWFNSSIKKLEKDTKLKSDYILPHMGWNSIKILNKRSILENIQDSYFYFLHSYYFDTIDKNEVLAVSNYGMEFAVAIQKDNIFGVQFHPEKSHKKGIKILKNFANLKSC